MSERKPETFEGGRMRGGHSLHDEVKADGGRYLLSIALTKEERGAMLPPTYGSKGYTRWLTEDEHAALCAALAPSPDTAALVRAPDQKALAAHLARWIFELGANSPCGPAHRMQFMHGKYPHAEKPGAGLAEGPMADQLEEALRAHASAYDALISRCAELEKALADVERLAMTAIVHSS